MTTKNKFSIATVVALALTTSLSGCSVGLSTSEAGTPTVIESATPAESINEVSAAPQAPSTENGLSSSTQMSEQLQYLIEEEKLAHDIYLAMFELWGTRVFGNILQSEQSHQSQVLQVMNSYKISDPRIETVGKFKNQDLQILYDQLIAKGSKSATLAYEVGIAIEELDIKDLTDMLATATKSDVIAMMENLRIGSENHLRAFNRQL